MQIDFARSGGFAGARLTAKVNSAELSAGDASDLEKLVKDADFFNLHPEIKPADPGPDRFEYRITVSMGPRTHTTVINEAVMPDRVKPLIDYLTSMAKAGRVR
jgi:emfourin